jgi:nucleoside-diphosphate-sugar epimerase
LELMEAPAEDVRIRTSYNLAAMSFSPAELAAAICRHEPGFAIECAPDGRQAIADSWPASVDDSAAREDWGWQHAVDVDGLVEVMLAAWKQRLVPTPASKSE